MLVKHIQLETSYLATIVDNSADIFIANFHPYKEFVTIFPCFLLRPSGESETIFIGRTIAPSFVSLAFKILILKVISRIPICPNALVGNEIIIVAFIQSSVHYCLLLLLGGYVVPRIKEAAR